MNTQFCEKCFVVNGKKIGRVGGDGERKKYNEETRGEGKKKMYNRD